MAEHTSEQPVQSNPYKMLFFGLLILLLLAGVGFGAYYFGMQKAQNSEGSASTVLNGKMGETATPMPTTMATDEATMVTPGAVMDKDIVPQGPNTVSYARKGKEVILRYRGKIYDQSNQGAMEAVATLNEADFTWYGLVNAPAGVPAGEFMYDEVFGVMTAPNGQDFVAIMRWGTNKNNGDSIRYHLFAYTAGKLSFVIFGPNNPNQKNYIPKIDAYNAEGTAISLNMFPCWNCGGGVPTKGLFDVSNSKFQDIGQVSYFKWTDGRNYEYKEYKEKECPPDSMGPCSEDPANLPMKTGVFTP